MTLITRLLLATSLILVFSVATLAGAHVDTVRFQSKLVNATLPYNVILPADYDIVADRLVIQCFTFCTD